MVLLCPSMTFWGQRKHPRMGRGLPSAPKMAMSWTNSAVPGGVFAAPLYLLTRDPLEVDGSHLLCRFGDTVGAASTEQ